MTEPIVRRSAMPALACALALLAATWTADATAAAKAASAPPAAAAPAAPEWIFPVIPDYGAVHPRDDAAVRPDPAVDYKIFVHLVGDEQDAVGVFSALDRLARIVNLMAYAKVPPEHLHIVALLDHKLGLAAMTDAYSQKQNHADNPNLKLIHALKKAGVELQVCSQALAGRHIPDDAVDPAVTITLSALTDMIVYGQKGYSYMQL